MLHLIFRSKTTRHLLLLHFIALGPDVVQLARTFVGLRFGLILYHTTTLCNIYSVILVSSFLCFHSKCLYFLYFCPILYGRLFFRCTTRLIKKSLQLFSHRSNNDAFHKPHFYVIRDINLSSSSILPHSHLGDLILIKLAINLLFMY